MRRKGGWNWLVYPAVALTLVVVVTGSMIRTYNVPAASMMPSLDVGDYMLAWRGYYASHAPERGEIAVFLHPSRGSIFVKRVIGLPGDTIQMKAGRLWINGVEVERQEEEGTTSDVLGTTLKLYRETLPNGVSHPILEKGDDGPYDTTAPFLVPADSYFVMGDNRDNSNDSRVQDFGAVPRGKFMDRPFLLYFSRTAARIGTRIN